MRDVWSCYRNYTIARGAVVHRRTLASVLSIGLCLPPRASRMNAPDQVLFDKIKQLPPQRLAEVEDFAGFLCTREKTAGSGRRGQGQQSLLCAGLEKRR